MRRRWLKQMCWSWWLCAITVPAAPALSLAQGERFEIGAGYAVSGPARTPADYAVFTGGIRLAQRGPFAALVEAAVMLGGGSGPDVACTVAFASVSGPYTLPSCDGRDLGPVARLGITGRITPWQGLTPYVLASAGVWRSAWTRGYGEGRLTADPYGPLLEAGVGIPLPDTDRRTVVELRYALFGQIQTGGALPARGAGVRVAVQRRW